jgi:hypothetical protein
MADPQCLRRRDGGDHPDGGGLLGLFASLPFWSSFSPWSRRRTVASDAVVEELRIEPDLP